MKCLLLFFFLPALSNAQVLKLKAYSSLSSQYQNGQFVRGKSILVNFLVVINIEKNKIKIYGADEEDYDIIKHDSSWTVNDIEQSRYTAIDVKGEKCQITVIAYSDAQKKSAQEEGAVGTMAIRYNEKMLILYLKKTE